MNKFSVAIAISTILLTTVPANALQGVTGRVTNAEPSYLPGGFAMQLDTSGCPWLWYGWGITPYQWDKDNVLTAYATILLARAIAYNVTVYVNDGTCNIAYLHFGQ